MQVICRWLGQRPRLEELQGRALAPGVEDGPRPGDHPNLCVGIVGREAPGDPVPDGPFRRVAAALRAYDVFPSWLVGGALPHVPLEPGDTFGICMHALPGLDLVFGARVASCFDERDGDGWHAGFTMWTLQGHPFVGEETFFVTKDGAGVVRAGLRSWSRPAGRAVRLAGPLVRRFQALAGRLCVRHLARRAE